MQHGGAVTDAYTLMGDPNYWNRQNAYDLYGLTPPPGNVRAAGQALPLSDAIYGDRMAQWWHPDSPHMWAALIIAGTGLLILGASVRVRVGKESAGASVGKAKGET